MKISARNQIAGKVANIKEGAVNCEVEVSAGANTIKSIITKGAVADLGLKVGDDVVAIIKASNVLLAKDLPSKISARNVIKATVKSVNKGVVNSEIKIDAKDFTITSIVTISATDELSIKENDEICAIVKASDILLGKN